MRRVPFPRPSHGAGPAAPARRVVGGWSALLVVCAALLGLLTALTGCGTPPELRQPAEQTAVPRVSSAPSDASGPTASAGPMPGASAPGGLLPGPYDSVPGLPPATAAPDGLIGPPVDPSAGTPAARCPGEPSRTQIITAVRRVRGLLPAGIGLRVRSGPFCAGRWQYTVVRVLTDPEPEPLQVVTRGRASSLTVVTTGTNVCTVDVRVQAPAGIKALACDGGIGTGVPGAGP